MNAPNQALATTSPQCTRTVVMIRPATFYAHPETCATNALQNVTDADPGATLAAACREFDAAVAALKVAGLKVIVVGAEPGVDTPDATFPNNWFSTHADGRNVLYPMATTSRRRERRRDIFQRLATEHRCEITSTLDLTGLEDRGLVVEGTGSLVFDREARLAYAALSKRTHQQAVVFACEALGYEPVIFQAHDQEGREIYHTNVMMSLGPTLAVLACSLVKPGADMQRVFDALERTNKALLDISTNQVADFVGNILFVDSAGGPSVVLSQRAWKSLAKPQRRVLEEHALPILDGELVWVPWQSNIGVVAATEGSLPKRADWSGFLWISASGNNG
jgi:hypothetical protein